MTVCATRVQVEGTPGETKGQDDEAETLEYVPSDTAHLDMEQELGEEEPTEEDECIEEEYVEELDVDLHPGLKQASPDVPLVALDSDNEDGKPDAAHDTKGTHKDRLFAPIGLALVIRNHIAYSQYGSCVFFYLIDIAGCKPTY